MVKWTNSKTAQPHTLAICYPNHANLTSINIHIHIYIVSYCYTSGSPTSYHNNHGMTLSLHYIEDCSMVTSHINGQRSRDAYSRNYSCKWHPFVLKTGFHKTRLQLVCIFLWPYKGNKMNSSLQYFYSSTCAIMNISSEP